MPCSWGIQSLRKLCALIFIQLNYFSVGFGADKPEWTRIFPAGGLAGTAVEVEATGKFPEWPVQVWSDTDDIRWTCEHEKGKLKATISATVPAGLHWVRLFYECGSTSVRPFMIGISPQRNEVEPNNRTKEATPIDSFPVAIHGILEKRGDVDLFEVKLAAGQLLVSTIDAAKILQSPFDANLQVLDSNGFVIAENLDHVGLDPYIEFTAPRDERYYVRVLGFPATPDSRIGFGGGNDWVYRLRLESKAGSFGSPIAYPMPTEFDTTDFRIQTRGHTNFDNAMQITLPSRIRGVIAARNQTNYFRFKAQAGSHYRMRVFAREYGSPLDATVAILDTTGKQLKLTDDVANNRDPELLWDAPKDGDYVFAINDFHQFGGEGYQYAVIIEERVPDFSLSIANDWTQTAVGKEVEIKVKVMREYKFSGTIVVEVDGLPDSISCDKTESKPEGDSSQAVTLKLKGSKAFQGPYRVKGRLTESSDHVRVATSENSKPIWLSISPD